MNTSELKPTIGKLVDLLFKTIKKENGRRYSSPEVALLIDMNENTLKAIRYGLIGNPGINTLIPIAEFFKIPLDFFNSKTQEEALAFIDKAEAIRRTDEAFENLENESTIVLKSDN